MSGDIEKYIRELSDTITTAELNYQIWWVLVGKETRDKFSPVMNRYVPYFRTAINAHFLAILESLYRLYETRPETINIPGLLKKLKNLGDFSDDILNTFDRKQKELKTIWIKVSILRNKIFSHRNKEMSVQEVYKEADLKPNELLDLIQLSKKLLDDISYKWDRRSHIFHVNSGKFTEDLLEALNEYHRILRNKF